MEDPRAVTERHALAVQNGVIRRSDALAAGMNVRQIARRVERRQWLVGPGVGVYVLAEMGSDPLARLRAAALGCDAVVWGSSALALHGVGPFGADPVVAAATYAHEGRGLDARTVAGLGQLPTVYRLGMRCATLELAVVSMACELSERSLHDLIDQVIRDRKTTWERVEEALSVYRRQGRFGSAMLGRIAADRSGEGRVPLSIWSRDVKRFLVEAGFGRPEMEWRVCDQSGRLVAQVDLAYPGAKYAIELDSVAFHLNREAFVEDRRRDAALARVGWLVRRFTWEQLRNEPELVRATIRADLAARAHIQAN